MTPYMVQWSMTSNEKASQMADNTFADVDTIPDVILKALITVLTDDYSDPDEEIDIDGVMDLALEATERVAQILNEVNHPFGEPNV